MSAGVGQRPQMAAVPAGAAGPAWLWRGRVPALDGLRGVSIVLVLLAHSSRTHGFGCPAPVRAAARHGAIGVDVFFVVSGFLITLLLLREMERTHTLSLKDFYRRRALRILPAYCAFLLILFGIHYLGWVQLRSSDWLGMLTYTVNFLPHPHWEMGHVWSLSIEEQFYLLWPALLLVAGKRRARLAALFYLAAAPVLRTMIWLWDRPNLGMFDYWTPIRMDGIAAGCLLALVAGEPAFRERFQVALRKAPSYIAIAAGVLAFSLVASQRALFHAAVGNSLNAAAIAAILWLCINCDRGIVYRFLHWRPLVLLGTLSYSLYLWQQLFLNPHNTSWACRWPTNLLLALAAATASHLFIEAPFLRMKERGSLPRRSVLTPPMEPGSQPQSPLGLEESALAATQPAP